MSAECSVTVIARAWRKINFMQVKSIQKSDSSREEAILESVGRVTSEFCIFFPTEEGERENVRGAWGP